MSQDQANYQTKPNKPQTIFRVIHGKDNPFVIIDKRPFEKPYMSWKAKGLLGYLLSRPDDWTVRLGDLAKRSTDKAHATRMALRELVMVGHARQVEYRLPDGTYAGTVYEVHEQPLYENPLADYPLAEKRVLSNKDVTDIEEDEGNPLAKFDDPQFGKIITDWQNLHTFLIPTHANLLGCMLDEWRSHVKLLPAGHPDRALDPVAVFHEAMVITGKNARNPHSLSYMDKIVKNWIADGYGHNPNERKPARGGKPAKAGEMQPLQVSPERQEELRRKAAAAFGGAK